MRESAVWTLASRKPVVMDNGPSSDGYAVFNRGETSEQRQSWKRGVRRRGSASYEVEIICDVGRHPDRRFVSLEKEALEPNAGRVRVEIKFSGSRGTMAVRAREMGGKARR